MITISAGHFGKGTGANGFLDEGAENIRVGKRVTEILRANGITTSYIQDGVNKNPRDNVNWLVAQHNKTSRKIDVQIHFNSSPGSHSKGIGVETLVHSGKNIPLATKLTDAIANVAGFKNRGVKIRTDLGFLTKTNKPAYLIEVCFVNDSVDAALYRRDFEKICQSIASVLANAVGQTIKTNNNQTVEGNMSKSVEKDAKTSEWAKEAVEWAKVNGISDGTYPQREATREEVLVMLHRALKLNK